MSSQDADRFEKIVCNSLESKECVHMCVGACAGVYACVTVSVRARVYSCGFGHPAVVPSRLKESGGWRSSGYKNVGVKSHRSVKNRG